MIKAASLALELDLRDFSLFLNNQGIEHRINEESGQQVVWVGGEREAEFVLRVLQDWDFSTGRASTLASTTTPAPAIGWLRSVVRAFIISPVSLSLILVCLIVAVVSELGARADRVDYLFYPVIATDGFWVLVSDLDSVGTVLRTLTPMFLHFGELHLVFNMLWLWYFGRQLEPTHPVLLYVAVIVLTAFASNTTQYLYSNYNNFGGMSGVVYGLVGYAWVIHNLMPRSRLLLNNNMFVVFVIALILMEILASSWIATAAHVGGLVTGVLLGVAIVVYYRYFLRRDLITK